MKPLFSLLLAGILTACAPQLERKNVPLLAGIRLPDGCSEAVFEQNAEAYRDFEFREWVISISMGDASQVPADSSSVFPTGFLSDLQQRGQPYSLALELETPLPSAAFPTPIEASLEALLPLLRQTESYPPFRLIFMGEYVHTAPARAALAAFLPRIKQELPALQCEMVYAAAPAYLDETFDWETPDLIGIRHQAPPDLDYRPWFRETHRRLSRLLIDHHQPALIVESNLINEDPLLLFRNELRFWNDSVDLRGIVVNTLYCRMALTDSTSHYALFQQQELQRYLREYGK